MLDKENYMILIETCLELDGLNNAITDLFGGGGIHDSEYWRIFRVFNLLLNISSFADVDDGMEPMLKVLEDDNTSIEEKYELLTKGMNI